MNTIFNALQHPGAGRFGWSLIHLLWQAILVAVLLMGALWLLRRRSANLRYVSACLALLVLPVSLAVTFAVLPERSPDQPNRDVIPGTDVSCDATTTPANAPPHIEPVNATKMSEVQPAHVPSNPGAATGETAGRMTNTTNNSTSDGTESAEESAATSLSLRGSLRTESKTVFHRITSCIESALPWIVGGWLAGLLALSIRHLGGWCVLQRLRRRGAAPVSLSTHGILRRLSDRFGIRRPVALLHSSRVTVPSLIGFLKPVILLPGSVLTGLTPQQLEAVLAHELAHVRRHDYLLNLLQTAIETFLFFHPVVWWISRRIRIERENCCDDLALAVTDDRLLYAQSLTRLEELRQHSATRRPAALTVAASGGSLLDRICRVLGTPPRRRRGPRVSVIGVTGLSGLLTVAAAVLVVLPGVVSHAPAVSANAAAVAPGDDPPVPPLNKGGPGKDRSTRLGDLTVLHIVPLGEFKAGATVSLGNGAHRFDDIPEFLKGRRFTRRNGYQGILRFRVEKAQRVYFAVYGADWGGGGNPSGGWRKELVTRKQLEKQGWKAAGQLVGEHTLLDGNKLAWIIFTRDCKAGETFAIRTHKYQAPILFSANRRDAKKGDAKTPSVRDGKRGATTSPLDGIVVLEDNPWTDLKPGATISLGNGDHRIEDLPELLKGRQYIKRDGNHEPGALRFRVTKSQTVIVAFYGEDWGGGGNPSGGWQKELVTREQLKKQGWKEVGKLIGHHTLIKNRTTPWIIYSRDCKPDEQFTLRNHKYRTPLLFSAKKRSDQQKPKAKAVDLGKKRVRIEKQPADKNPPGLFVIGSYKHKRLPTAKDVYQRRLTGKIADGTYQLVGRLPGMFGSADRFEVESFSRRGHAIFIVVKHRRPVRVNLTPPPPTSVYLIADLPPQLPEGKYVARVQVTSDVIRNIPVISCPVRIPGNGIPAELKKLAEAAVVIKSKGPLHKPRGSDQSPIGLDLSRILKLTGQDKDRAKFPRAHQNFAAGVNALVIAKRTWALCSLLDYPNVDARILAVGGLRKLADPHSVPVLLAAAKSNNYFVSGSENATLHGIYRSSLVLALQKTTGLTLVAPKMKNRFNLLSDSPDFKKVDVWLKAVYLADSPAANRPSKPKSVILKQVKTSKDRGTLRDAYEKVRGDRAPHSKRDDLIVVPGPQPKDQTPSKWFNSWIEADYDLTAAQEKWLLFRSKQFSDNDVEWIERVERKGNEFVITMNRAIWLGPYAANVGFHEISGVNLGKLPAGEYTVKWVIRESGFEKFDKNRWPKDIKAWKQTAELKSSFKVLPARKAAIKPERTGLQFRATAPAQIERGLPLAMKLEFRSDPTKLAPGVKRLNSFLHDAFLELQLTGRRTGRTVTIKPYDPTSGLPIRDDGKSSSLLDGKPLPAWNVVFPLAKGYDLLVPGEYQCRVRFAFPQQKTSWWRGTDAEWKAAGFWHGTVVSPAFSLKVTADKRAKKRLLLPKRLQIEKRLVKLRRGDPKKTEVSVVVFRKIDAEEVAVSVRNGHTIGARYYRNGVEFMLTTPPKPKDVYFIDQWRGDPKQKKTTYTLEVFETAQRPVHFWRPGPGRGGYKVLWKKSFTVSLPKADLEKSKRAGADYLAKNKTQKGVITTKSGLQYKILKAGAGKSPTKTDTVKIRYIGTLTDGTPFATSHRNRPYKTRVTDPDNPVVIKGWTEALQLMKVGAKWKLFVPPDLGWGAHSLPSNVGPYAVLLFEIELLEIVKKTKTDKDVFPGNSSTPKSENPAPTGNKGTAKNIDVKQQYRFLVIRGVDKHTAGQKTEIDQFVTLGEPLNIRTKHSASASGVLRKTKEGGLHFKGRVTVRATSSEFDVPIQLGKASTPKAFGFSSLIDLFFVRFERPKAGRSHVIKEIKTAKDRGTLHDAHKTIYRGEYGSKPDLLHAPPPNGSELSQWFDSVKFRRELTVVAAPAKANDGQPVKGLKVTLSADKTETELLPDGSNAKPVRFRSKQRNDNDRMWVTRIERQGKMFTLTMQRAVWKGTYTRNTTFHELHGVNLGKLPAGSYTANWIINRTSFKEFDKDGWPKVQEALRAKAVELSASFQVRPADKVESKKTAQQAGNNAEQVYDDKARRFRVTLPKGWSATPTSYSVQHYRDVFLCINSKGNKALRIVNERKGDTERYDAETVSRQLTPETVYIDFAIFDGPGGGRNYKGKPDTVGKDLRPLLKKFSPKKVAGGKLSQSVLSFIKNEHHWHIYAYFREPVKPEIRAKAIELLRSFRFVDKQRVLRKLDPKINKK